MTGHCPRCNSTLYEPDPTNGGAGRNRCLECGTVAPVVEFHQPPADRGLLTQRTSYAFYDAKLAAEITATGQRTLRDMLEGHFEPLPPGVENDPKTGNLRPARRSSGFGKADEPPAPIRQYKDE